MRLACSLARARGYRSRRGRESQKKEFQRCSSEELGRAGWLVRVGWLARSFVHSLARNVRAREKMGFPGVELQVEISIGGQREVS